MDRFTERLSEYLDGELTPGERAALDAHLTECTECRATLDELGAVVERAASLPARPPRVDLWSGIAPRLNARERLTAIDEVRGRLRASGAPRRFSFTAAQLAAAAALLVATSAGLAWFVRTRTIDVRAPQVASSTSAPAGGAQALRVANFADAQYDAAVADLRRALDEGRGRLDSKTIDVLEKNLGIIDEAIEQARKALAADPANTYLNSYLADARRRKLELLRDATAALANLPG